MRRMPMHSAIHILEFVFFFIYLLLLIIVDIIWLWLRNRTWNQKLYSLNEIISHAWSFLRAQTTIKNQHIYGRISMLNAWYFVSLSVSVILIWLGKNRVLSATYELFISIPLSLRKFIILNEWTRERIIIYHIKSDSNSISHSDFLTSKNKIYSFRSPILDGSYDLKIKIEWIFSLYRCLCMCHKEVDSFFILLYVYIPSISIAGFCVVLFSIFRH